MIHASLKQFRLEIKNILILTVKKVCLVCVFRIKPLRIFKLRFFPARMKTVLTVIIRRVKSEPLRGTIVNSRIQSIQTVN